MPTFNFSTIIASSSENIASLTTYLFPLITISFAVVAVVAIIRFIIGIFYWVGQKLSSIGQQKQTSPTTYRDIFGQERERE